MGVWSIFLPLAMDLFFSKPSITNHDVSPLRNEDAVKPVRDLREKQDELTPDSRTQGP